MISPLIQSSRFFLRWLCVGVALVLLVGCSAKAELAATQANLATAKTELQQTKTELAAAQAQIASRVTDIASSGAALATAQAQIAAQATQVASSRAEIATAEAAAKANQEQVDELTSKLDAATQQLGETKAELEDVKFAADRLLTEAEAALKKQDLQEAKRLAGLLNEKYAKSPQATRAAEIVKLIEKAIADKAAAEKARLAAATKNMRSNTDDVRGITFYKDTTTTQYTDVKSLHLYIGKNTTRTWLRLRIQYTADDWLFIDNFVIKADDQRFDMPSVGSLMERDNAAGAIWEWYDGPVRASDIAMLKAIVASKSATLRYNGKQYYSDRAITAAEKQALQNVLDAFVALGGDLSKPEG